MKKVLTLLLSFMMLLNTAIVAVAEDGAAEVGGVAYATLNEAVEAAGNGDTVTITSNIRDYINQVTVLNKSITIDTNGFEPIIGDLIIDNSSVEITDGLKSGSFSTNKVLLLSGSLVLNEVVFVTRNDVINLPDNGNDKMLTITEGSRYLSKTEETPAILIRNQQKANVVVNFDGTIGVHDDPSIEAVGDLTLYIGENAAYEDSCGDVMGLYFGYPWWDNDVTSASTDDEYNVYFENENSIDVLDCKFGQGSYNVNPENHLASKYGYNYYSEYDGSRYVVNRDETPDCEAFADDTGLTITLYTSNKEEIVDSLVNGNTYYQDLYGAKDWEGTMSQIILTSKASSCSGVVMNEVLYIDGKYQKTESYIKKKSDDSVFISKEDLVKMNVLDGDYSVAIYLCEKNDNMQSSKFYSTKSKFRISTGISADTLGIYSISSKISVSSDINLNIENDILPVADVSNFNIIGAEGQKYGCKEFDWYYKDSAGNLQIASEYDSSCEYYIGLTFESLPIEYGVLDSTEFSFGPYKYYDVRNSYPIIEDNMMDISDYSTVFFKYEYIPSKIADVTYNQTDGLTITFGDEYKDMVKTLTAGESVEGLPAYTMLSLKYLGSDYDNLTGSIYNGDFYNTEYIKKVDDNTIQVSSESIEKGRFIDGEYEINVTGYGAGLSDVNIGTVQIATGNKGEDYYDTRVDELHVEIDESKLQLYAGDAVVTKLGAKVTDENGNPVKAEVLLTRRKSILINGYRFSYYPAENDPDTFEKTPDYLAESEYYLTIDYHPLEKVYDTEFKIYLNGEEIEVNGTGQDKGFGSGGLGCMLKVMGSDSYRTTVSLGYPKAKMNKAEDVAQEVVEEKIEEIFTVSEDGSKKEYVDELNNAASNTTISKALGEEGKVNVTLRNATVESVVEEGETKNAVITKMSFDITPVNSDGDSLHGKLEFSITFRLPVDSNAKFTIATVYHEGKYLDTYEIKTDEKGNKYIEVASDSFSVYDVYYANEKTLPGDIDGDGVIKGVDRILLRNYLTKKISSSDIKMSSADVNKDGDINAQDRVYLRNLVTGKIS